MLLRIGSAALLAGLVAGMALAALQHVYVTPLIRQAEVYEHAGHGHAQDDAHAQAATAGWRRAALTAVADAGLGIAYALLLTAVWSLAAPCTGPLQGLAWALGGYAALVLAPALGMPPALPGMAEAPLRARQLWWAGTAVATAAGLWLLLRPPPGRAALWRAAGLVLLALPHATGAPAPPEAAGEVPAALAARFVAATLVTQAVFWALLGTLAGWAWQRGGRAP